MGTTFVTILWCAEEICDDLSDSGLVFWSGPVGFRISVDFISHDEKMLDEHQIVFCKLDEFLPENV